MSVVFGCDVDLVVGKVKLALCFSSRRGWGKDGVGGGVGWVDYGRGGIAPCMK